MADNGFRLPGSSYEELIRIVEAYGNFSEPASPEDVSKRAAMNSTTISKNNAFLVSVGILDEGRKKAATEKGKALAQALEYEMPDDIGRCWRKIIEENEFLQSIVSAIKIRKGMEPSSLRAHVAYSAGQPKNKNVMAGAGAIVEILKVTGLVAEEDGKLVVTANTGQRPDTFSPNNDQSNREPDKASEPPTVAPVVAPVATVSAGDGGVTVNFQVQIQCSADEIDALAPKLLSLIKRVTNSTSLDDLENSD